jgi:predicted enzyme related to lactoylglutathione lyase
VKIGYETKLHGIHNIEHFEIPPDRAEELMGFYSSLSGWQFEKGQRPKITG